MKKRISTLLAVLLAVLFLVLFGVPEEQVQTVVQPAEVQVQPVTQAADETQLAPPQTEAAQPEEVQPEEVQPEEIQPQTQPGTAISEEGFYTTKEDVALYLHTYGHLPDNFITKNEAASLGWEGGGLEAYMPDGCIGGDKFGNYEGLLPKSKGRFYFECDIDTMGKQKRGAKRIVFSNDGLIYYTDDHYESFELLYGEP